MRANSIQTKVNDIEMKLEQAKDGILGGREGVCFTNFFNRGYRPYG